MGKIYIGKFKDPTISKDDINELFTGTVQLLKTQQPTGSMQKIPSWIIIIIIIIIDNMNLKLQKDIKILRVVWENPFKIWFLACTLSG